MNTAHCLIGAEGLLALKNYGVQPDVALSVINSSSGRSMATEERLPQECLTGKFDFGFKLGLMSKDCRIADKLMTDFFPKSTLIKEVNSIMQEAEKKEWCDSNTDYSSVVKVLEQRAGQTLRVEGKES